MDTGNVIRHDLRLDRHPCEYRKTPHQIQGGCGCFCGLCELTENNDTGKLVDEGNVSLPIESQES